MLYQYYLKLILKISPMLKTYLKQPVLKFAFCFVFISMCWAGLLAQNQEGQDLYYWSDLGKTNLTVDPGSFILLAKDKAVFETKLKANAANQNIKKVGRTGFLVYENKNVNTPKKEILKELALSEENWEIQPGLKSSAGSAPFYPTQKVLFRLNDEKTLSNIDNILDKYELVNLYEIRPNVFTIEVVSAAQAMTLANEIYESGHAKFSQPNFTVDITVNNDPFFDQQFQMHNTGQRIAGRAGTTDIDSDALEAWNITTGSSSIRVAVFDQGLEAHPDLTTSNGTSTIIRGFSPDVPGGNGAPTEDADGHGMSCAGIINAAHNNIGVRGMAPGVRLLGINIFAAETIESLARTYTWAMDNGADVLSNSWGFTDSDCSTDHPALNDAIENAFRNGRNGRGCLIVFSSGNTSANGCVTYPARLNTVTAVGAITSRGNRSFYSQFGPELDLVAPSSDQLGFGNVHTIDRVGNFGATGTDYISFFGGTSAAAPVVAGAAALVYSVNPNLTVAQMRNILHSTADDMGPSGRDNNFGHGRINAHQAVLAAGGSGGGPSNQAPSVSFALPTNNQTFNAPGNLNVTVNASDSDGRIANVRLFINNTLVRQENIAPYNWGLNGQNDTRIKNLSAGTYTLRAVATDDDGATRETTISITVRSTPITSDNIALNKPAIQSSTRFNGPASRAVDGNTRGNSFTHTDLERGWWRVDLENEYDINTINVFNRTNCCTERLSGARIYVGNVRSTNPNDYTFVGNLSSNSRSNFSNLNVRGRYVLVSRSNTDYLSLAEVQVFGTRAQTVTNVALNKPTRQSSTGFNGPASRAVDGNTRGNSFTHTQREQGWWRVDLQNEYDINSINVFNRTNCCSERLSGARIYVGNVRSTNPNDYTFVGNLSRNARSNFRNLNVSGRYVLVSRSNTDYLSLAEVQVFGTRASRVAPAQLIPNFDTSSADQISISPNPAKEVLNIDLSKFNDLKTTYIVSDINGRLLMEGQFDANHSTQESIDLYNLSNGTYFLRIEPDGKDPAVHKFVVIK